MKSTKRFLFVVAALLLPVPAFAHHAMGGATPLTFVEGFSSGLAHPVIGLEHLLFLLTAGALAYSLKAPLRYAMPLLFVVSAIGGTNLHLAGFDAARVEVVIALSLLLGGGLVLSRRRLGALASGLFFAVAGTFHGYAYAAPIVGADSAPLLAYLCGLALIQGAIIMGMVTGLGKLNAWAKPGQRVPAERFAGGLALVGGVIFLTLSFV